MFSCECFTYTRQNFLVQCLLVAATVLLYTRLVRTPLAALELICTKRQPVDLPPSYHRQLDIIKTIASMDSSDLCTVSSLNT